MRKTKKRTKRNSVKYPALNKKNNVKLRQEYIDMDYISKLSEKEKAWLNKALEEWYSASFDEKPINKGKKIRKQIEHNNNARNRDVYGLSKASGKLKLSDKETFKNIENKSLNYNVEDELIRMIDLELDAND